jgi:hypothetical protein
MSVGSTGQSPSTLERFYTRVRRLVGVRNCAHRLAYLFRRSALPDRMTREEDQLADQLAKGHGEFTLEQDSDHNALMRALLAVRTCGFGACASRSSAISAV